MNNVTLLHGDCLGHIRALGVHSVDSIITDPPYATTGTETSWVSREGKHALPRETQFYEAWLREQLQAWRRVLKPTGAIWFTCDWHGALCVEDACFKLGMKRPTIGVWYREGLGMGHLLRKVYECFIVIPMPGFKRLLTDEPDLWVQKWIPGDRKNGHSAEKPVELMARAIRLLTPPGGTVLDPFMGSGSTGVAAIQNGYEFIGIERDLEFFIAAEQRINQAPRPMFSPLPDIQAEQIPLLQEIAS